MMPGGIDIILPLSGLITQQEALDIILALLSDHWPQLVIENASLGDGIEERLVYENKAWMKKLEDEGVEPENGPHYVYVLVGYNEATIVVHDEESLEPVLSRIKEKVV